MSASDQTANMRAANLVWVTTCILWRDVGLWWTILAGFCQPARSGSFWRNKRQTLGFCQLQSCFSLVGCQQLAVLYPVPQLEFLRQIKQQWGWRKKWQQQRKKMPLRFTFAWWARRSCRVFWGWKWQCLALPWHEMHSFPSLWWLKCELGCVPDL